MSLNARQAKLSRRESPRPKLPNRQVLIRLALAVIAAAIAFNIPHSLIPMFKECVSEATPPPEIQNVLDFYLRSAFHPVHFTSSFSAQYQG